MSPKLVVILTVAVPVAGGGGDPITDGDADAAAVGVAVAVAVAVGEPDATAATGQDGDMVGPRVYGGVVGGTVGRGDAGGVGVTFGTEQAAKSRATRPTVASRRTDDLLGARIMQRPPGLL